MSGRGAGSQREHKAEAWARLGRVLGSQSGRTMESGTEEHELNGDLRPGSSASVRPQHLLSGPLCDLGPHRPLWARLGSGDLWVSARCARRPHCGVVVAAAFGQGRA